MTGFWRRVRITPASGVAQAELEDDFHCMSVLVHHDGEIATQIIPDMRRAPWSACPGAVSQLEQTFTGVALSAFAERGEKKSNCTHLFDLAVLAARHAFAAEQLIYDVRVSDPVQNERRAEIWRNGTLLLSWKESRFHILEPASAAGLRLDQLRSWIDALEPDLQEPARLLQWGNMLANGRIIPLELQSDATRLPPNCFTFQPERAATARRIGEIRDFSQRAMPPLAEYEPYSQSKQQEFANK